MEQMRKRWENKEPWCENSITPCLTWVE
jgi:hypothetical protein